MRWERFEEELDAVMPEDLPNRERVVKLGARHLELITAANEQFNLTRITGAREAAIKHVLDSVLPWRYFAGEGRVIDAGTGAGFPGVPLAMVLPDVHFVLSDSVGKKARFVESAAAALGLRNVEVVNGRAEEYVRKSRVNLITGRAVTPTDKFCSLFGSAVRGGARAILYKGPDVETEMVAAAAELRKQKLRVRVLDRYDLPEAMGTRALVEVTAN